MKKILFSLLALAAGANTLSAQSVYFASYPTLTPDARTVIFTYEGDLWKTGIAGGSASRLTAMAGEETNPRVSPDGKWIAFSSSQYGNNDVYVMPMNGGEIRQLTFHDASDEVDSWSWDSKTIYFTSNRYNSFAGYKLSVNGGTPVRLFDNYFNTVHNIAEHPKTGELFFNDTWESKVFAHRKRYKGEYNPDIVSYDPKTKALKNHTDYKGKDLWATLDQNGNIFFVSDEGNDEYNLYSIVNNKKTQLTRYETSIKRPSVSANGQKVVFEKDYQIYVYDVASKKAEKLDVQLYRNNVLSKEQDFDIKGKIENFDVSPDGKKMAFVSRGELFVSDIDGKFIRQIAKSAERAAEVNWLSDNRTLLFNQTSNGYQNWFTVAADGSGQLKQLTKDNRNNRSIALNKARTMAVYLSGRDEVRTLDLKTMQSKTTVKDEIWGFQNSSPSISPDDQYVLFTAIRNFEQDIFVHNLKSGKTLNLTNTGVSEATPSWSPDGKHIYFMSSRTRPAYPYGFQEPRLYRMPLDKYDTPFRTQKFDALFTAEPGGAGSTEDKGKVKSEIKSSEPAKPVITINTENIMKRLEPIGPAFGSQYGAMVFQKGDKTTVYYVSNHAEGKDAWYRTILEPFESPKTEKVVDGSRGGVIENNGKFFLLANGAVYKYNAELNKADKLDVGYTFRRNLAGEFNQMFEETWANLEENFYDEEMHGLDWNKMKTQYGAYLPHVTNRSDLRILLNDMLGELNASHLGFSSNGPEEQPRVSYRTLETGIMFDQADPYKVSYVVAGSNADRAGIHLQAGDVLTKVNGQPVDPKQDRNFYFTKPSLDKELSLTFERAGKAVQISLHPESSSELRNNLYDEWVDHNQKRVDELSKNRIAYTYMKNMGSSELESFLIDMVSEADKKDGLILDLRYNTGGNVHDAVLQFLSQRPYLQWKYRGGKLTPQPNFAPSAKPIVLLINEQSLSDAEMTATGFKELKLGKVIGTETYRWIIFTSGKGLVDGSFYRLPSWGCYTLDGKNIEKEGVAPDIYVKNTLKDRIEGKDPQLERAVQEILKDLK
ncbi:MAG TPA: LpqB family beta-propeller domain-containing protein [Sphingobacteriaceae bacterium]